MSDEKWTYDELESRYFEEKQRRKDLAGLLDEAREEAERLTLKVKLRQEAVARFHAENERLRESLRAAPMPYRESTYGEWWDEKYDEWWHAHASEAALGGVDGGR